MKNNLKDKRNQQILFVCEGNTCRSPMLEAAFNDYAEKNNILCEIGSAGIYADGSPVSGKALEVLSRLTLRPSKLMSRKLTDELAVFADYIFCVDNKIKKFVCDTFATDAKVINLSDLIGGKDIIDPFGQSVEAYETLLETFLNVSPIIAQIINA